MHLILSLKISLSKCFMSSLADKRLASPAAAVPPSRCWTLQTRATVPGVQCFPNVLKISSGPHRAALFPALGSGLQKCFMLEISWRSSQSRMSPLSKTVLFECSACGGRVRCAPSIHFCLSSLQAVVSERRLSGPPGVLRAHSPIVTAEKSR